MTADQQQTDNRQQRKGRLILITIFVIAFLPMLLATYMYFNQTLVPAGRTNNGTFVLPPLEFDRLALAERSGPPLQIADLPTKWRLLILSDGVCEMRCQQAIYKARQVNIALHKESRRVTRYYVDASGDGSGALGPQLQAQYPRLNQVVANRSQLIQQLAKQLDASAALAQSYILVVDPIGNVMMYYHPDNSGKEMLEDLKRLLKVSHIG